MDIYEGPGLAGVPRGTVKSLRLMTYSYAYRGMGSETDRVGFDGPWDVVRIMGTVPVESDGSAYFRCRQTRRSHSNRSTNRDARYN